jgi:hypothetical protein
MLFINRHSKRNREKMPTHLEDAMRHRNVVLTFVIAYAFGISSASGEPCSKDIAEFQHLWRQEGTTAAVGSAPQTVDAQLEHQPTPASVEKAKKDAKTAVGAALREAKSVTRKCG